ncbi:MAG: histidine phosphatase family protein [Verrucomicrobiota bacterium]|nr:histidine phosphatase family protein [Verrucomicrobiota bacterium]
MQLVLIRHGNTFEAHQTPTQIGARTDLPLTTHGRAQAAALAAHFKPTAIYTGPLQRQLETARLLNGPPPLLHPALTELDYGAWEGLTSEQIASQWPTEYTAWNEESIWPRGLFARTPEYHLALIYQWLDHLLATYPSNALILGVTSNGLLRLFHSLASEQGPAPKVKTGHFCELLLTPTEISLISWNQQIVSR